MRIFPRCVPGRLVDPETISDEIGDISIVYAAGHPESQECYFLKTTDVGELSEGKIKRIAWNNIRKYGARLEDLFKDSSMALKKPPALTVQAPFGFDAETLEKVALAWGEKTIYILPESPDEVILLAGSEVSSGRTSERKLKKMIVSCNKEILQGNGEILSYKLFRYNAGAVVEVA